MPNWVKTSDRLPPEDGSYFVIGKMGRGCISFKDGEWNKDNPHFQVFVDVLEWLDESELSFTIKDMKAACLAGANWGDGTIDEKPADWFKRVYNIDITKQ